MNDENKIIAAVTYLVPILGGIIIFLIRKTNYEKFHAIQSIFFWVGAIIISIGIGIVERILSFIPVIGDIFEIFLEIASLLFGLGMLLLWLLLMWKAYKGEMWKLPILGEAAAKMAK